ncbi:hypothetical protein FA15DRAFT_759320 [Coprinopsis marcescibilis]|uniref:Uncharacterized protein n=1 Tax=Coprinopsis marcescibilis TaxID=230819 RepID=A0A5C3KK35_COPMA|nr:hypothetical protein FA15DRAFT_759320 [Coprinopsis marcescibilis]
MHSRVSCNPTEWFAAFLNGSSNKNWSGETASEVRIQLDNAIFSEERGWVALLDPLAQSPLRKDGYAALNMVYESIIEKAKDISGVNQLKQTTSFRTAPNESLKRSVPGKAARTDHQSEMVILPAAELSCRSGPRLVAASGSKGKLPELASECAGIYEFKKDKANSTERKSNGIWSIESVLQRKRPATEEDVFEEDGNKAAKRAKPREGRSNLR